MPFGQSIPIAAPVSLIAGFVGGEIALALAKECFPENEFAARAATFVGHSLASATAGYAVNVLLGLDVTGAAVTTGQTAVTATAHVAGHAMGPGVLRF